MSGQIVLSKSRSIRPSATAALVLALLALSSPWLAGQQSSANRLVHMTVTDPLNRFVTGLDRDNFEVIESGAPRPTTLFTSADDPIAIAVVGESRLADLDTLPGPMELIQTPSVSEAVRQLEASGKPRKALVMTAGAGPEKLPAGIFVVSTNANSARKAVVEACNQYTLGFVPLKPTAGVDIVLKQPRGLPALKAHVSQ